MTYSLSPTPQPRCLAPVVLSVNSFHLSFWNLFSGIQSVVEVTISLGRPSKGCKLSGTSFKEESQKGCEGEPSKENMFYSLSRVIYVNISIPPWLNFQGMTQTERTCKFWVLFFGLQESVWIWEWDQLWNQSRLCFFQFWDLEQVITPIETLLFTVKWE